MYCTINDCENYAKAREMCSTHYARWQKNPDDLEALHAPVRRRESGRLCDEAGCENPHDSGGLCQKHRRQKSRRGTTNPEPLKRGPDAEDPLHLFMSKLEGDPVTGCWNWTGTKLRGYGKWSNGGKSWQAHRFAWANVAGLPLPEELDHIDQHNPACCRPGHLQAVDRATNMALKKARAESGPYYAPDVHQNIRELTYGGKYGLPINTAWNSRPDSIPFTR